MRTALGFTWLMWRKARFAYLAALGSALFMGLARSTPLADYALPFGSVYFTFSALALLASLTFADSSDIASSSSWYPRYMLLAPVGNRALATWPMIIGAAAISSAWAAFAVIGLYPRFGSVIIVLPGLGLVALLMCLQASTWTSLPVPYARSILSVISMLLVVNWGLLGYLWQVPPGIIGLGYVGACALAYALGISAVTRTRRGDSSEWVRRRKAKVRVQDLPPFRAPMQAQVWIESRRNGYVLPGLAAFTAFLFLVPVALGGQLTPATFGNLKYDPLIALYLLPFLLLIPISSFDGCCASVRDNFREDFSLSPFLASRPMTDAGLIEAKLRMAVLAVVRSWAILGIGVILLLLSPVSVRGTGTRFGVYLADHASLQGVASGLLLAATLAFLTWRGTVSAMWLRLSHRGWLRNGVGVGGVAVYLWAGLYSGIRVSNDPGALRSLNQCIVPALTSLAALKLCLALVAVTRIRSLHLISDKTLVTWSSICLLLGTGVCSGFCALLPSGPQLLPELALIVFLLVPLVRVQLAVLVLHDNRHR